MSKNKTKAVQGSYRVRLVPVGTPKEAQEALEAAIGIIITNTLGNSILGCRTIERDVENNIAVRHDVGVKIE